jgi:AcrR family transcriptional regulator
MVTSRAKPAKNENTAKPALPERQRYKGVDINGIRRKQIILAVRQIIARDGIEAVTIANIAIELGASRGVVVYHFANKEEILHEVLSSAMKDADRAALQIGSRPSTVVDFANLVSQVAKLAQGSGDWWKIYFAYLAHAHVNPVYREALAWSDRNYRETLSRALGDDSKALLVLALMKGLAMQVSVTPDIPLGQIEQELRKLMMAWDKSEDLE